MLRSTFFVCLFVLYMFLEGVRGKNCYVKRIYNDNKMYTCNFKLYFRSITSCKPKILSSSQTTTLTIQWVSVSLAPHTECFNVTLFKWLRGCLLNLGNAQCVCGGGCMLAACPDDSAASTATPPSTTSTSSTTTHPWLQDGRWWENRRRRAKRQAPSLNSVQRTCHFCFCSPCEGKSDFVNCLLIWKNIFCKTLRLDTDIFELIY